jgi:hypothetical protein
MGTSRFGSSVEHAVPESQARSTSSSDGVDIELWTLDGDTGSCGFVDDLVSTVESRYVCRCPTDIEAESQLRIVK